MQMHGQIMILALAASVWTAGPARAQQSLTAADYVELQMLNAYYVQGLELGDRDLHMRAFAPGGVLRQPAGLGTCNDPEKYCESVQRPKDAVLSNPPVLPERPYTKLSASCRFSKTLGCIRQHYILDNLIVPTAEGARGVAHLLVWEKDPGKGPVLTEDSGAYLDTYVKGADGRWGIALKQWMPFTEKGNPYK